MIELTDVTRTFRGGPFGVGPAIRALDGVSLRIGAGEAVGVVGLNGAGKSTLLRTLLGFIRPTSGDARIGEGREPRAYVERYGIAYVPEHPAIPRGWTVRGALRAYAMMGNLGADAWQRVDGALERLGLGALAERRIGGLSKGNLQRVALAQAILGDRQLMVLDEPTDGLDPVWISELRAIVAEWRAADPARALVIASHNLAELERMTERVILLHKGRIAGELRPTSAGGLEPLFLRRIANLEANRA